MTEPVRRRRGSRSRRRQGVWVVAGVLAVGIVLGVILTRPDAVSGVDVQKQRLQLAGVPSNLSQYEVVVTYQPHRWVSYNVELLPPPGQAAPPPGAELMVNLHRHVNTTVINLDVSRGTGASGEARPLSGEKVYLLVSNLQGVPATVQVTLRIHDTPALQQQANQAIVGLVSSIALVPLFFLQRRAS